MNMSIELSGNIPPEKIIRHGYTETPVAFLDGKDWVTNNGYIVSQSESDALSEIIDNTELDHMYQLLDGYIYKDNNKPLKSKQPRSPRIDAFDALAYIGLALVWMLYFLL